MVTIFPPVQIAAKIALSAAIGLLVGLEREWAHKDLGVRTFALATLLGMLAWLVSPAAALMALVAAVVLVGFVNAHSFVVHQSLEITTSVALLVTVVLGILIGQTHYFTAVAAALVMTGLLAWKTELLHLVGDLRQEEIRGAVLLGLLSFVIYPLLPNRYIDRWNLLNPREAWLVVVILAGIGFLNYALLRIWGARGLYSSAVLGGLVNSAATVAQLSRTVSELAPEESDLLVVSVLLATGAMMVRNLVILAIFAAPALPFAFAPILAMAAICFFFAWRRRRNAPALHSGFPLGSPVSLPSVGALAALFVAIEIVAALTARRFGSHGFLAFGFLAGLVSSSSTTAAAGVLFGEGQLTAHLAASATVITSVGSAVALVPLIRKQGPGRSASRVVARVAAAVIILGLGLLALSVTR